MSFFSGRWAGKGGTCSRTNGVSTVGSLASNTGSFFGVETSGGLGGILIAISNHADQSSRGIKGRAMGLDHVFACATGAVMVVG
jgi:hypothetical protein